MDFQFQHDIPGEVLPEDWGEMLARQARSLEEMLTRVAEAVTAVNTRPDRSPAQTHQLHALLDASEQFLTTMAQQSVSLEREAAYFQEVSEAPEATFSETVRRWHIIDQVTVALHANLTAARQYLAEIRHSIKSPTAGA